jgi:hypothetical protein
MNISLNVLCEGEPVHVTALYNFKQVNDVILLHIYNQQQVASEDLFVKYVDGAWLPEHFTSYLTVEAFRQINKELTKIYNLHTGSVAPSQNDLKKKLADHLFMLSGFCS